MPLSRSGKHSDVVAATAVVILGVDNNLLVQDWNGGALSLVENESPR